MADEAGDGQLLMEHVIDSGRLLCEMPDLNTIRQRAAGQLAAMPPHLHDLRGRAVYPVDISEKLQAVQEQCSPC